MTNKNVDSKRQENSRGTGVEDTPNASEEETIMKSKKRTLHFSIAGEFITRTAREWFFVERKPYSVVEDLLLSCMTGTDTPDNTLKLMAQDVLLGRAEFRGDSGDDSFCYVKLDDPASINIFAEYDRLRKEYDCCKTNLSAVSKKYENVISSLQMWADGSSADALRELNDNDVKRLLIDILRRYGEVRKRYTNGGWGDVCFVDDEVVDIAQADTGNSILDSYLQQRRIEKTFDGNYGWLDPMGHFTPVDWGEHQSWAHDEAKRRGYLPQDTFYTGDAGDILIKHGWVLLHNPALGVAEVSQNPIKPLTKAQKEFLYGYYTDRKQHELAEKYLSD